MVDSKYFYSDSETALLTPEQMDVADKLSVKANVSSLMLMENAGRAVAEIVADSVKDASQLLGPIVIIAGPGNNGGDGFVAARYLETWGYPVQLYNISDSTELSGDAKVMADRWQGEMLPATPECIKGASVIIDAMFGTGIARPLGGLAAQMVDASNRATSALKVAIDLPSGLCGATGQIDGACFQADLTVTFFALKPGHLLIPGRYYCGGLDHIHLVDIGIAEDVLSDIMPKTAINTPELWQGYYSQPSPVGHKYDRGHVLVLGGKEPTLGASRLTALSALRSGAGLVTLAAHSDSYNIQATALTDVMVKRFDSGFGFLGIVEDPRMKVIAIGPGAGIGEKTAETVLGVLSKGRVCVVDADAISSFGGRVDLLKGHKGTLIMTPHEGEFARILPDLAKDMSRIEGAKAAAELLNAVVVLKGPDTIIASPHGHAVINVNAPAWLSVAGTGDVLSGIIASMVAQGMPPFEAACAGVWFHSSAATDAGKGLIASDLIESLRTVMP